MNKPLNCSPQMNHQPPAHKVDSALINPTPHHLPALSFMDPTKSISRLRIIKAGYQIITRNQIDLDGA